MESGCHTFCGKRGEMSMVTDHLNKERIFDGWTERRHPCSKETVMKSENMYNIQEYDIDPLMLVLMARYCH
jgi:hypothetical protein